MYNISIRPSIEVSSSTDYQVTYYSVLQTIPHPTPPKWQQISGTFPRISAALTYSISLWRPKDLSLSRFTMLRILANMSSLQPSLCGKLSLLLRPTIVSISALSFVASHQACPLWGINCRSRKHTDGSIALLWSHGLHIRHRLHVLRCRLRNGEVWGWHLSYGCLETRSHRQEYVNSKRSITRDRVLLLSLCIHAPTWSSPILTTFFWQTLYPSSWLVSLVSTALWSPS